MGTAAHNVRALGVSAFMARQRRLLQAGAALSALMLPAVASGQTATTLDEVVVRGPKPAPAPRPAERPRAKPADTPSTERSTTAPAASTQAPRRAVASGAPVSTPALSVVATTPITGVGFNRDKIPAMVQTLTAEEFSRTNSANVVDTLMQRIPGVNLTDVQGNGFTSGLRYRGFAASPLQGTPQGLAIYMNGVRVNEAFGDTVNWDLIPTVAIGRADMWTNNPAFGLNALGGAVNFQMKDGFNFQGFDFDTKGGSFGRVGGSMQYGVKNEHWATYLAAEGLKDDGWRYESPSRISRLYGDIGFKNEISEIHFNTSAADNYFGVVGPTPVELINRAYPSIYTWPQTTHNQALLTALNGRFSATDHWIIQTNLYMRNFKQEHLDGNTADVERCSNQASPQFRNHLCLEDDGFPRPPAPIPVAFRNQFAVLDQNNFPIPCPTAPPGVNGCASVPYGTVDRTFTRARTYGGAAQVINDDKIFGHGNYFNMGASIDQSRIGFSGNSELGYIYPDLSVGENSALPGSGSIIHTLGLIGYAPVTLGAQSTYYGAFLSDTFDITNAISVTAGGRYNLAKIAMTDLLGTSPDLNGNYTFGRFNPMTGATFRLIPKALSFYIGYSESNRAPTPLELGCSNSAKPCLLEGFLISDPPLQQVVSFTREVGFRGEISKNGSRFEWNVGAFHIDSKNDIINVASVIQGRGVFQNVEGTRRKGVEANLRYQSAQWLLYANYAFLDATYQFTGLIPSPNNPSADANGNIFVTPGKQVPGIPRQQVKFGADYAVTPAWKIGTDVIWVGSQWYVGDDANQNVKVADYWVTNLHTSYQITKQVQVYGLVNNLFNRHFAAYGTYFDPQSIVNAIPNPPTDHRTITPGAPLAVYVGLKVKL
jgi:iron complex outermembrane recepter protein